jgi:hypothetical protein
MCIEQTAESIPRSVGASTTGWNETATDYVGDPTNQDESDALPRAKLGHSIGIATHKVATTG